MIGRGEESRYNCIRKFGPRLGEAAAGVFDMRLLAFSALVFLALVTGAQALSTPAQETGPKTDAAAVLRFLQVARGYETCVLRCESRYEACVSNARSDTARRSCRLDQSLCESDCGRFGSR